MNTDHKDRRIAALKRACRRLAEQRRRAVAAREFVLGTTEELTKLLEATRRRLDEVRLAALVIQAAAERMVENTGGGEEVGRG